MTLVKVYFGKSKTIETATIIIFARRKKSGEMLNM